MLIKDNLEGGVCIMSGVVVVRKCGLVPLMLLFLLLFEHASKRRHGTEHAADGRSAFGVSV